MVIVQATHITLQIGSAPILKDISFSVEAGKTLCIIGSSGSGKTSLLKTINRLYDIDAGEIRVFGKPIDTFEPHQLRQKIGFVLQQPALFPHWTAAKNIGAVPRLVHWDSSRIEERCAELMELMDLDPLQFADRFPSELSGGQQQRIAIARALAANPDLVLFDEPFSALDPITRSGLQSVLLKLKSTLNKTMVFVTHDINEAFLLGDEILILDKGEVIHQGTPEAIKADPVDAYVKQFISGLHA